MQQLSTYFAPSERASLAALVEASDRVQRDETVAAMLEAMPTWAMVVNHERQIVAANQLMIRALGASDVRDLLGKRPGEAMGCEIAHGAPSGCGTARECAWCGAAAIEKAWHTRKAVVQECLVMLRDPRGQALDLEVLVSPAMLERMKLLVIAVRDVGAEKRRRVLERVFFHDVMNTASGIQGIATVLTHANEPSVDAEFKQLLVRASGDLVGEIAEQRQLMAAESGEIVLEPVTVGLRDLLAHVRDIYSATDRAEGRTVVLGECADILVETDSTLLRRILSNMVKNAIEASRPGETVKVWAEDLGSDILIAVHNPTTMLPQVSAQIFHRSFSTKGPGRGIGTYSIKLLGERYLQGHVAFTTSDRGGTTFTLRIPARWPS